MHQLLQARGRPEPGEPSSLGRACEARGTGQDGVLTQLGTVLQKETEPSSGTGSLGMSTEPHPPGPVAPLAPGPMLGPEMLHDMLL